MVSIPVTNSFPCVQYSISTSRANFDEINMDETMANLAFTWMNHTNIAIDPDPRFVTLDLMMATRASDYSTVKLKQAEFEELSLD